jgi:hypothetical protein
MTRHVVFTRIHGRMNILGLEEIAGHQPANVFALTPTRAR